MKQLIPLGLVCLILAGCSSPSLPSDVLLEVTSAEGRKEVSRVAGGSGSTHIVLEGTNPDPLISALQKLSFARPDQLSGSSDYSDKTWYSVIGCDDWVVGYGSPDQRGVTKVEIASKGTAAYQRILDQ